jgi:hypothetical protein
MKDDKFHIANPNGKENGDKELKRNIQLLLFLKKTKIAIK